MSLSTFKRDSNKVMRQMKKTKEPIVLTGNGINSLYHEYGLSDSSSILGKLEARDRTQAALKAKDCGLI